MGVSGSSTSINSSPSGRVASGGVVTGGDAGFMEVAKMDGNLSI